MGVVSGSGPPLLRLSGALLLPSAPAPARHPLLWPLMATLLVVGWSSGFVGIRYASEETSVLLVLFWRTLLSGLILLPFALGIFLPAFPHIQSWVEWTPQLRKCFELAIESDGIPVDIDGSMLGHIRVRLER